MKALRCVRCNKPIRKGDYVLLQEHCVYEGRNAEGQRVMRPWFGTLVLHSRCMQGGITAAELRQLKANQESK